MPITQSVPSPFTGPSGQQRPRLLPPLPIRGDNGLFTASIPSARTRVMIRLPPLPVNGDDQIPASLPSAEPTRPLSPPPMYSDEAPTNLSSLTRPLPPLPICEEGRPVVSSVLSTRLGSKRSLPPLPISYDTPTPLSISSTSTTRALPPPPPLSVFTRSVRPLPPPPDASSEIKSPGFFTDAQNFVLNHPNFTETINHIRNTNEKSVFDILEPYTTLDATKDSNARYPPPQCHPKTRLKIRNKLMNWISDEKHECKMFWICGFAGTGKSAIAQTFASSCDEWKKLGGTYFFSKLGGRNRPETVIPTLAYQLAISVPDYKSLISTELANDPLILRSSPPNQFKRLIIQPFTTLQRQRHHEKIVIVLDGLEECEGHKAQLMILEMISDSLHTTPDLPLRWLIFSRPEPHLKHEFLRIMGCGYEELVIDAECRDDVERFVRERVLETKANYEDVVPHSWPSQDELNKLLDKVAGLFDVASGSLEDIAAFWGLVRLLDSMNT